MSSLSALQASTTLFFSLMIVGLSQALAQRVAVETIPIPDARSDIAQVAAFDKDGSHLLYVRRDGGWARFDLANRKLAGHYAKKVQSATSIAARGTQVALGDAVGNVSLWDATTGKRNAQLQAPPNAGVAELMRFNTNGSMLAVSHRRLCSKIECEGGAWKAAVKVWSLQPPKLIGTIAAAGYVREIAFSPESNRIVIAEYVRETGDSVAKERMVWLRVPQDDSQSAAVLGYHTYISHSYWDQWLPQGFSDVVPDIVRLTGPPNPLSADGLVVADGLWDRKSCRFLTDQREIPAEIDIRSAHEDRRRLIVHVRYRYGSSINPTDVGAWLVDRVAGAASRLQTSDEIKFGGEWAASGDWVVARSNESHARQLSVVDLRPAMNFRERLPFTLSREVAMDRATTLNDLERPICWAD